MYATTTHPAHITNMSWPRWQCYHTNYSTSAFPGSGFLEDHRLANDNSHHEMSEGAVETTEEIPGDDMIDLEQHLLR